MAIRTTGLTYADLEAFPEDNLRRELIDGELVVTPAPGRRHQRVVGRLFTRLFVFAEEHGGQVYVAPRGVYFADHTSVQPDVLFVGPASEDKDEERFIRGAPDIVVEVSSSSTRPLEIGRKLGLYERFGVPEYWYVDLEANRVEIYRLETGRYARPVILIRGDTLESSEVPGFTIDIDYLLGPKE